MKKSSTYKLIVPEKVEEKIRYLLRKYPSTEWSGVLFTSYQGTFEDNNLVITCEDIYPMDLGSAVFTEFKMSEDVASYMANNIELFDCDLQLVHSHHSMSTQPSGTDLNTLREEGNDRNCFVSLIVNNAGVYYAAITRKVESKKEVTVKDLGTSYEFFGEGPKAMETVEADTTREITKTVIEYFDLEVERHEVHNSLAYLDTRFEEILNKKYLASNSSSNALSSTGGSSIWNNIETKPIDPSKVCYPGYLSRDTVATEDTSLPYSSFMEYQDARRKQEDNTPYLFDNNTMKDLEVKSNYTPDPQLIHEAVVKIVLCSFIVNAKKVNIKQWSRGFMVKKYTELFHTGQDFHNMMEFNEWCEFIVAFILDHFDDSLPLDTDYDTFYSETANALINELKTLDDNIFIQEYINVLMRYI